uniref:LSDAT_euk domain-containing protein n=1 Tax=Syphacia muris TaxID=451379 RepID=A0A0N5AU54_9BILA
MNLFDNVWGMPPPKLIITIHGGLTNFDLQPKLARVFRKGIMKAARTTGAWIITSGVNAGVVRHVAAALEASNNTRARSKVVSIGIAAWGMLKEQADLIGQDVVVPYHSHSYSTRGKLSLNNRHSYFLLVDNGTVGRDGADIILRKRLETYIAEKQKIGGGTRSVPVVCVVLEGGTCTIKSVVDYVTSTPVVPVVICDGSGRAADLLAFAHQCVQEDGKIPDNVRPQLLNLVESVFGYNKQNAENLLTDLTNCAKKKNLMTIFRLGEGQKQDLDHSILTALLKGQNLSPPDQLSLALAWNRVDIARSDILVYGQEWPKNALNNAMTEALMNDRVDFVRLLLENGVSMKKFLTITMLEELYNTDKGPPNTLYYIVRDVVKIRPGYRYRMPHIGLAIEKLMGNTYKSTYTTDVFRAKWSAARNRNKVIFYNDLKRNMKRMNQPENILELPLPLSNGAGSRALSTHLLWRSALRRDNPMNTYNSMIPDTLGDTKEVTIDMEDDSNASSSDKKEEGDFKYPFSELLLWAVLTKRQEMALCMWQHGEEAMAKALVACRLYKSLAKEAAEDYLEVEICDELRNYAEEFRKLALELLEYCYHQDDAQTLQLLTYELASWGNETCLSLAVMVNHKEFLAHPCCQILLADLWHGGLRIRSHSNLRVVLGLLFPPSIFLLEFKSREELMLQPQTAAEHEDDIKGRSSSSSSSASESSSSDSDYSFDDDSIKVSKKFLIKIKNVNFQRPIKFRRKLYEFYVAPITTFWAWTLSFCIFVCCYTYTLLIKTPPHVTPIEWFTFAYVFAFGMEHWRKYLFSEPKSFTQKARHFFWNIWNALTALAVATYFLGFLLRFNASTRDAYGRIILACNSVLWTIRLLDFMSVHPRLGPYITMAGKMVQNMLYIIVLLCVALLGFGLARQSITFPNEEWHPILLRNIFYKPYFMLYGEVYADEIDPCGDEEFILGKMCVPGHWVPPLLMTFFLLVANILLMSMLLAIFKFV